MFSVLADSLLTVIYPQACRICGRSVEEKADGYVCRACWLKTRIFTGEETLCAKCGMFLSETGFSGETFCRRCDEYFFDRARAVGLYQNALAACIISLKSQPFLPKRLRKLFISAFLDSPFSNSTKIIPVPLSRRRFKQRGFNQSALLAQLLSKKTGILLDEKSLARAVHTVKHRAMMDRQARCETVENAFEVKRPRLVENEKILLIDDVFTSGATANACAKALKEKGAAKVYVLTIARAF